MSCSKLFEKEKQVEVDIDGEEEQDVEDTDSDEVETEGTEEIQWGEEQEDIEVSGQSEEIKLPKSHVEDTDDLFIKR